MWNSWLEPQPQRQLDAPRIIHCRNLPERRRRICRVSAGADRAVPSQVVAVIERIERLADSFQAQALGDREGAAEPGAHAEIVVADSGVAADERSVHRGTGGGALDGGKSGSNVEGQRGVILQHAAQLKAMTQVDGGVEDGTMPLVVIGPSVVLPEVVGVDGRIEEGLTHIVQ